MPALTPNTIVVVNSAGTGLTNLANSFGNISVAGSFTTTGNFGTTLVQGANVSLTLPLANGTLATLAGTETLTNKTISGSANTLSNIGYASLANIADGRILANFSGGSAAPAAITLDAAISATYGSTQGSVFYRDASSYGILAPGTGGQVLTTHGAGANPTWTTITPGTGTVTSVATNNGLTGGPITASGTIGLASIATSKVMANFTGGSTAPVATTMDLILDNAFPGSGSRGEMIYRGASIWQYLAAGTAGQFLQSNGSGGDPAWAAVLIPGNNLSEVSSPSTARTNLGLKSWATKAQTVSTSGPSGTPADGDVWLQYVP